MAKKALFEAGFLYYSLMTLSPSGRFHGLIRLAEHRNWFRDAERGHCTESNITE